MTDRLDPTDIVVTDVPDENRFEARVDGTLAGFAEYILSNGLITFSHTEVKPAFEGRGIGGVLVQKSLDAVRAAGDRKVLPLCPFVKSWIGRHPAYHDLVM